MYAAAGGASLASRRQQKTKQKAQRVVESIPKQPQAKQFHNYTEDAPRLSRVERGALRPPQIGPHDRRHSTSNYHLKEVHGRARIRESPSISIPVQPDHPHHHHHHQQQHDAPHHHEPHEPAPPALAPQLPQIEVGGAGAGGLERRCSFVRQVEEMGRGGPDDVLDRCNHICNFEIRDDQKARWEDGGSYYYDEDAFGSLEYPFSERQRIPAAPSRTSTKMETIQNFFDPG